MRTLLKTISPRAAFAVTVAVLFGLGLSRGSAQSPTTNRPWVYQLLEDSQLTDDCPVCGRPTILAPMRGRFELRLLDENPLFARYAIEKIQFTARGGDYRVTGQGTFQIGGEVALLQQMVLEVQVDNGFASTRAAFTNTSPLVNRRWPMLDVTLEQTNGTLTQVYSLRIAAAPLRDLWISTATSFAPTSSVGIAGFILGGDLLSQAGHIVKRNADFYTSVGAMPPGPALGLDAVDILPGGEIAFSLGSSFTSKTLGPLQHGDLLSTRGRILRKHQALLAPFGIQPPVPDVGLDAVHFPETGEILFSIQSDIFSERLGQTLHRGDLLSSNGTVVRTFQQLLARFHPVNGAKDYGLDALYVWPSGEIWFSTEDAFEDAGLGLVTSGDLLSDQGYRVLQNLELLAAFRPPQNQLNFGLDALYVVTDATPSAPAARMSIRATPETGSIELSWQSQGRVFQVEQAGLVSGPFQILSPIIPDLFFEDREALGHRAQSYYRLRQW